MRLQRRVPLLVALALFARAAPEAAAQQGEYPHGDTSEPLNCTLCHTQEGWSPAKQPIEFDHNAETGFPRTGRHADLTLGAGWAAKELVEIGKSTTRTLEDVELSQIRQQETAERDPAVEDLEHRQ